MRLAVTGLGMITAVGRSAARSCAAIRAGACAPRPVRYFHAQDPETAESVPITAYPIQALTEGFGPLGRWVSLAARGFRDLRSGIAVEPHEEGELWGRTAVVLAVPVLDADRFVEVGGAGESEVGRGLLAQLRRLLGVTVGEAHLVRSGHAGAAEALGVAQARIGAGAADRCLILGADSYVDEQSLEWLSGHDRLKTAATPAGLMPGEAGAALLVEPPAVAARRRARPAAFVEAAAIGVEADSVLTGRTSTGKALTAVVRGVLPRPVEGDVVLDLNGEEWRAREWALVRARASRELGAARAVVLPARSLGDTGAASGLVGVGVAIASFSRGYAGGPEALVLSCAEHGPVGAVALRAAEGAR